MVPSAAFCCRSWYISLVRSVCLRIRPAGPAAVTLGDRFYQFGVLVPRSFPTDPSNRQVVPPDPTVDRPDEICQDLVARHRDDLAV